MNLFDLSLRVNSFPIKEAKLILKEIQDKNEADFENYLLKARQLIVQYHLDNNSYYNSLRNGIDSKNWDSVPIMTKQDLQIPLQQRLSRGFNKNNVYINKTSGSSGDPFVFAKDRFCHALTWAIIQNRFSWYGLDFNSSLQARFYGIPLDLLGNSKERLKDAFSHRHRFSVFDLSDNAFKNCVRKFKSTPFKYINGYTSPIVQFAKYLERENINLNTICPSLECCIVTSEMLFDEDKICMENQFGIPIINEYGASELDLIAFENPQKKWQLNSESLFVEIVDDDGNVLPNGQEGRIIITSLYNKAHPFIRYDIGDLGIISESTTFKKPLLKKLTGRTNDIATLPSGKRAAGLTFYYITKRIIEDDGNVQEFIIEQIKLDTFKIIYKSKNEISDKNKNYIAKEMTKYLESGLKIIFERRAKIDRSESGKLKQFKSYNTSI